MKTLVVAPHPDDETLGCGGTLLRRKAEGGTIGLLLMTELNKNWGLSDQRISQRADEIDKVRKILGITKEHLYQLCFPTTRLDTIPMVDLVTSISEAFKLSSLKSYFYRTLVIFTATIALHLRRLLPVQNGFGTLL